VFRGEFVWRPSELQLLARGNNAWPPFIFSSELRADSFQLKRSAFQMFDPRSAVRSSA
jgi:hypothetical protein